MAKLSTGDTDEAMDIVQDAMLAFVRHYKDRPADQWGPLFQRVLQNRITDWYRRTAIRRRFRGWLSQGEQEEQAALEQVPDPNPEGPESSNERDETLVKLEQALRELPARQRQAFLLRVWEGLDTAETAKAMNCSQGSVKTHYSRAVKALRNRLEEGESP